MASTPIESVIGVCHSLHHDARHHHDGIARAKQCCGLRQIQLILAQLLLSFVLLGKGDPLPAVGRESSSSWDLY